MAGKNRGLSGDPVTPLRAELQGRSPAGRGGGVRLRKPTESARELFEEEYESVEEAQ